MSACNGRFHLTTACSIAVVSVLLVSAVCFASRPRVAVWAQDTQGHASKTLHFAIANVIADEVDLVPARRFYRAISRFDEMRAGEIRRVCMRLGCDMVVDASWYRERVGYGLEVHVRSGASGQSVVRWHLRLRRKRLPKDLAWKLGDKVMTTLRDMPTGARAIAPPKPSAFLLAMGRSSVRVPIQNGGRGVPELRSEVGLSLGHSTPAWGIGARVRFRYTMRTQQGESGPERRSREQLDGRLRLHWNFAKGWRFGVGGGYSLTATQAQSTTAPPAFTLGRGPFGELSLHGKLHASGTIRAIGTSQRTQSFSVDGVTSTPLYALTLMYDLVPWRHFGLYVEAQAVQTSARSYAASAGMIFKL